MKKHAPATLRNREAILAVLREELPDQGTALEIGSGSGEHIVYFAHYFSDLDWQPSDTDWEALASIRSHSAEYGGSNLRSPIVLDAIRPASWAITRADAILCINMTHISPWSATEGLFAGAARLLSGKNLPLCLYGPFFEQDVEPAASNLAFDESLRSRNLEWGLRDVAACDELAGSYGFMRTARHAMPANNLMLIYRSA